MAVKPDKPMLFRMFVILLCIIVAFCGVSGYRLVKIMLVDGTKYKSMAVEQQLYDSLISAPRGDIYDRNMQTLATSSTAWTVYVTPNSIKDIDDEADKEYIKKLISENLSKILEVEYDKVYSSFGKNSYYVVIKKKVEKPEVDKIREFIANDSYKKLSLGKYIGLEETTKRYYPNNSLASVVLGFVGSDDQGLSGIESYYDNTLKGIPGRVVAAKNAAGTDLPMTYERVEEATKGKSLVLTLDSYIQYSAEKYLQMAIEEHKIAERGAAIVMNVKTGGILALAVKGDFNPNEPFELSVEDNAKLEKITDEKEKSEAENELLNRQWRNKAVSDTYEPGSVFKIITTAIALEENLINKSNTFYCNGHTNVAGQPYDCHKAGGHGTQTLAQAISNSCNPAFITIGQLAGVNTFSKYFEAFGLTEKTGIDLPGESMSYYHKEANMGPIELASSSFGQTFNVTPIQLLTAICATVNGGYLVEPHIVEKTISADGKVEKVAGDGYKRQVISESTSATIRELMEYVAENGAKNALVPGYRIGAKTGTSQKVSKIEATGDSYLYIGSCVTVAPADDPEIAVLVMLDEPKGDKYYGGIISAPTNSRIMADVLPYLGFEASYSDDELKNLAITVPDVCDKALDEAKSTISNKKLQYQVVGSGDKVLKQLPEAGSQILNGGIVILYTEESGQKNVTVPNMLGLTATKANKAAASAGINIEFSGNTTASGLKAYRQSVEAGTKVEAGTIVTVYFRDETTVDG